MDKEDLEKSLIEHLNYLGLASHIKLSCRGSFRNFEENRKSTPYLEFRVPKESRVEKSKEKCKGLTEKLVEVLTKNYSEIYGISQDYIKGAGVFRAYLAVYPETEIPDEDNFKLLILNTINKTIKDYIWKLGLKAR